MKLMCLAWNMLSDQFEVIVKHFSLAFSQTSVYLNQCHEMPGTRQKVYFDLRTYFENSLPTLQYSFSRPILGQFCFLSSHGSDTANLNSPDRYLMM